MIKSITKKLSVLSLIAVFVFVGTLPVYGNNTDELRLDNVQIVIQEDEESIFHFHMDSNGEIIGVLIVSKEHAGAMENNISPRYIPDAPQRGTRSFQHSFNTGLTQRGIASDLAFSFTPSIGHAQFTSVFFSRTGLHSNSIVITDADRSGNRAWVNIRCNNTGQTGGVDFVVNSAGFVTATQRSLR
ncbi:MAG: hypothetical protein FWE34_04125 [Defluviitaleaceae bacterium]|nr:hypothetical protein [Defluviitaleaceae bacterium]